MSKKKTLSWNPDSARRSFKIAKKGSQTDLNSEKNQRKVSIIQNEDALVEDDFGIDRKDSKFKIDEQNLKDVFRTTFTE